MMNSLKYRIAITIFILEAIMMSIVLITTLTYAVNKSKQHIRVSEQVTMELVDEIARTALITEEYDIIQPYIEKLPANPDIIHAVLVDDRNIVVATDNLSKLGDKLPVLQDTDKTHWRIREIKNAAGDLGKLAMEFSSNPMSKTHDQAIKLGILIALLGMSIIAMVGITFGDILTKRLKKIDHAVVQMGKGEFNISTSIKGKDELGRLGETFDKMAKQIEADKNRMANMNKELEIRVKRRTKELTDANHEYESFAYSVSHDLRAPLRSIHGFSQALKDDYYYLLDNRAKDYLSRIQSASVRMGDLIDALLELSRINRAKIEMQLVDLSRVALNITQELGKVAKNRKIDWQIQPNLKAYGDSRLLYNVLFNLLGNACKFTKYESNAKIEFGARNIDGEELYYVKDNGAGFNEDYKEKLFAPFHRLHTDSEFEGTGIGLSTVQRIIHRHGGRIWGEGKVGQGATFYFTLPDKSSVQSHAA